MFEKRGYGCFHVMLNWNATMHSKESAMMRVNIEGRILFIVFYLMRRAWLMIPRIFHMLSDSFCNTQQLACNLWVLHYMTACNHYLLPDNPLYAFDSLMDSLFSFGNKKWCHFGNELWENVKLPRQQQDRLVYYRFWKLFFV